MGYDISKITNETLKRVAEAANIIDKNKLELNEKEFEIFKNASINAGLISEEDFNKEILGLDITVAPAATDPIKAEPKAERKPQTEVEDASKKDLRARRNRVEDVIRTCAENGGKIDGLMEALRDTERFNTDAYATILDEVEEILTLVKNTNYNSKDDIKALKKTVLENYKPESNFHRDILNLAIDMAKNEIIDEQYKALVGVYERLKETTPNASIQGLYEQVVDMLFERRGVEGKAPKKEYYTDEVLAKFKEYAKADANTNIDFSLANSEATTTKGVRKDVKSDFAKGDDISKAALKDRKEDTKTVKRRNVAEQRAEELKSITAKELKRELGYKLYMDLEGYLATRSNGDGTYDVSDLSSTILYVVGDDYLLNQSDNTNEAEKKNTMDELRKLTGLSANEIDWNATKDILKLCKIEREKNSRDAAVVLGSAGLGALSSALTAYMSSSALHVEQKVQLNLGSNQEIIDSLTNDLLANGVDFDKVVDMNGNVTINVLQEVFLDPTVMNILKTLPIGLIQGLAMGLIFGQSKSFEENAVPVEDFDFTNPTYTDIDEYKEHIRNKYPAAKADAIIALAMTFVDKDGKFNSEMFYSALTNIAGVGSNLNPQEWSGARLDRLRGFERPQQTSSERRLLVDIPTFEAKKPDLDFKPLNDNQIVITKQQQPDYIRKYKDTWSFIVRTYYPEAVAKLGEKAVVRELKKLWNVPATDNELPKQEVLPTEILGYKKGTPDEETINANRVKYAWGTGYDSRVQNYKSGEYGAEAKNLTTRAQGKGDTIDEAVEQVIPTKVDNKTTVRIYNPDGSLREIREIVNN